MAMIKVRQYHKQFMFINIKKVGSPPNYKLSVKKIRAVAIVSCLLGGQQIPLEKKVL